MKMTSRLVVVLACAWCGLPLLGIALHPAAYLSLWTQAPLNLADVAVRLAFAVIGWGAYARRGWTKRAAMALAIAWTVAMVALAVLTPFGLFSIAMVARSTSPVLTGGALVDGVGTLVLNFWRLLAWSWAVAIASRRLRSEAVDEPMVSRSFNSRSSGEDRLIQAGAALILAWVVAWPLVHNLTSPLRELRQGFWTSDAAHARIVLTEAQRRALPPQALQVVDDINDDIASILAGQPTRHSLAKRYDASTWFTAEPGHAWYITAYSRDGRIAQLDLRFYRDDLRIGIGERTIVIR